MRLLIVKLSSIGDVVHTLPAAAALRRHLPAARITWVVERRAGAILRDCPVIDEVVEIDTRAWRKGLMNRATLAEVQTHLHRIRGGDSEPVDIAIDFQGLIKSGVVALASGAARRIGFETAELREKASRAFLNEQVETAGFRHVIDKNLALAYAATGRAYREATAYEFPITVPAQDEQYILEATGAREKGFAIINPGGGWATKLWPAERYGEVADWLWSEHSFRSFITYGPGELPLARSVEASARTGAARPLASTLMQFVALARRASLFVGGDTGPLHLAAACGTPIVGIYGPTSPERNGPFDGLDVTVGLDIWCREDCHRRSCWHWQCMEIGVGTVIRAITSRLAAGSQKPNTILHA